MTASTKPVRLLACCLIAASGLGQDAPEHEVKAAYLGNFAGFVEWPKEAFAKADSPVIVGVLGKDPFGEALEEILKAKTAHGRGFSVKRSSRVEDLLWCHVLFVPASEQGNWGRIREALKGRGLLTVGESAGFASKGGVISFYLEGKTVRFEVNPAAARRAGLTVSAKLLKLARIVEEAE